MEILYAIVDWEDGLSSVIHLKSIQEPRKGLREYKEGDHVKAKFQGKIYSADIIEISDDQKNLNHKLWSSKGPKVEKRSKTEQPVKQVKKRKLEDTDDARKELTKTTEEMTTAKNVPESLVKEATPMSSPVMDLGAPSMSAPAIDTQYTVSKAIDEPHVQAIGTIQSATAVTINSPERTRVKEQKLIRVLEKEVRCLKKEMRELKEEFKNFVKTNSNKAKSSEVVQAESSQPQPNVAELTSQQIVPSISRNEDTLRQTVSHLTSNKVNEIVKTLTYKLFTTDDLLNCSFSGKRTIKSGDVSRPPLNQDHLATLKKLVLEKCPSLTHNEFREKLQNIMKVARKNSKKMIDL